jgi:sugar lactone lactonase YvrE
MSAIRLTTASSDGRAPAHSRTATLAHLVIGQPDFYSYQCDDGTAAGDVDGTGADSLCGPEGIAVDGAGNLYVADTIDSRVLEFASPFLSEVTSGQSAATVFGHRGSFVATSCGDGGTSASSLCDPRGVALDAAGNLYVADSGASRVLEYNTPLNPSSGEAGAGDTIAEAVFGQSGTFGTSGCNDGTAVGDVSGRGRDSQCGPVDVAIEADGNLYVSDTNNNRVLEYNTPLNPSSGEPGAGDTIADRELGQADLVHNMENFGGAQALELANPSSTNVTAANPAIDANGHLYVPDTVNSRVLGWTSASAFSNGAPAALVVGQPDFFSFACDDGAAGGDVNGVGPDSLCEPGGVAVDAAGNLCVADTVDNRVLEFAAPFSAGMSAGESAARVFGQGGSFTAIASGGGADGLDSPAGVAVDPDGNVFVADGGNSRVLEYDDPLAGGGGTPGTPGSAGDTTADLAFGQNDSFTTVACNDSAAGGDASGVGPDSLCHPSSVALDASRNLYVADYGNGRVLEYNTPLNPSSGETGAGDTDADFVFGQNGSFTTAGCSRGAAGGDVSGVGPDSLCQPASVAADGDGNVYIADAGDNRTLEYNTPLDASSGETGADDANADLVLGQSSFIAKHCSTAISADRLCTPNGVAVDGGKNLYIADSADSRVLEYDHPRATATPTPTASPAPTPTPTKSPTPTPTPASTPTPAPSATATPTATASPSATATPTPFVTPTPVSSATPSATATPSSTPTPVPTPTPTPVPGGRLSVASSLKFGPVGIGVSPETEVLKIHNLSPHKTLTVSLDTLVPPFALLSGTEPFAIALLHAKSVRIEFTPAALGRTAENLTLSSSDPRHPIFAVALAGRGAGGQLTVDLPPPAPPATQPTLAFGAVRKNTTLVLDFSASNTGRGVLSGSVGAFAGGSPFQSYPGRRCVHAAARAEAQDRRAIRARGRRPGERNARDNGQRTGRAAVGEYCADGPRKVIRRAAAQAAYRAKKLLIASSACGSTSEGACATPGTSTRLTPRCTLTIRAAVSRERMSLSAPRTIRIGAITRLYGSQRSIGRAADPPRGGRRTAGSIFHASPPSSVGLTDHRTHSPSSASDSFAAGG